MAAVDASASTLGDIVSEEIPFKLVDPQKMGWEERARIYGFKSSLFPCTSLGMKIISPELLADKKCSDRRLIVSGEQLGAGLPIPLYNPSNPLFYAIYSSINPPCGVMQLNGNAIRVISEWVARSEGKSYYYKKLPKRLRRPPEFWTVKRFFQYYRVEKTLSKEKAPWSVGLGKISDSSNPLGDVDLSGSKKNNLLRHSSDEVWFTKPMLIEGPVLYGYEDEDKKIERTKFSSDHNLCAVDFYRIFFSDDERTKSQVKIAQAKKKKADKAKTKSREASDGSDAPKKKRKESLKSAPTEKGEINQQSDVLTDGGDTAHFFPHEPSRKKAKTLVAKRKGSDAGRSTTTVVTRRQKRRLVIESNDEKTEDDRTPRGMDFDQGMPRMLDSQTVVPSPGRSFFDDEASRLDQPELYLNQYGSNMDTPLGVFASDARVPPNPNSVVQRPSLGSTSQAATGPNASRDLPSDDLSNLLRAHSMDPRKYPLDPSVSGFLAQVFSGTLDKNSVASVAAYHPSFAEAQKYLGKFLFDLADARGLEVAQCNKDIQLLKQGKKNLKREVNDLKESLKIAASERDSFKLDADVQRDRALKLEEELNQALSFCDKKDSRISSLESYIEEEGDRASVFGRDYARTVCRSMGIRPPYFYDGVDDPNAVLETDKDLISAAEAELIISELRKAKLAENAQAANDYVINGQEGINVEQKADSGVDSQLDVIDESLNEESGGNKGGDESAREVECIDASDRSFVVEDGDPVNDLNNIVISQGLHL